MSTSTKRERSLFSLSAIILTPAIYTRNIGVFAAMNKQGRIDFHIYDFPVNGKGISLYIKSLAIKLRKFGILTPISILDNARIYKKNQVGDAIVEIPCVLRIFPPIYHF